MLGDKIYRATLFLKSCCILNFNYFRDVRKGITPPDGTKVIEANGRYVMPGRVSSIFVI